MKSVVLIMKWLNDVKWILMENILTMKWSNDIVWKIFRPRNGQIISYDDICLTMRLGNIIYRHNTYISMLFVHTVTIYAIFIEGASI